MRAQLALLIVCLLMTALARCAAAEDPHDDPRSWADRAMQVIDQAFGDFERVAEHLIGSLFSFLIDIARLLYMVLALGGLLMWATGWSPHGGRRMLIGALVLALIVELLA